MSSILAAATEGGTLQLGSGWFAVNEGANVAIASRARSRIDAAARRLETDTGRAPLAVVADVTDPDAVHDLIDRTVDRFGAPHIVVANAGGPPSGPFDQHDDDAGCGCRTSASPWSAWLLLGLFAVRRRRAGA